MICVSLGKVSAKKCIDAVKKHELCELRLDQLKLSDSELKKIFYVGQQIIASYRKDKLPKQGKQLLLSAINSGASYVDVDINWPVSDRKKVVELARKKGVKIIASYHNYKCTPTANALLGILKKCRKLNPDVIKVSCMSKNNKDNVRLLNLLAESEEIITVGMGNKGRVTRLIAPLFGAFCTFASLDDDIKTASGQFTVKEMKKLLTGLYYV